MAIGTLLVLLVIVSGSFVWLLGIYTRTKLKLNQIQARIVLLEIAVGKAQGALMSLADTSIPGVTDSAIRTLDSIDITLKDMDLN